MYCASSGCIQRTGSASANTCNASRTAAKARTKTFQTRRQRRLCERLSLQILVHDLDEFLGGENPWRLTPGLRIDHMFADVVLYDLRNEAVQCAPACGCLLQDLRTLIVGLNGAVDRLA